MLSLEPTKPSKKCFRSKFSFTFPYQHEFLPLFPSSFSVFPRFLFILSNSLPLLSAFSPKTAQRAQCNNCNDPLNHANSKSNRKHQKSLCISGANSSFVQLALITPCRSSFCAYKKPVLHSIITIEPFGTSDFEAIEHSKKLRVYFFNSI